MRRTERLALSLLAVLAAAFGTQASAADRASQKSTLVRAEGEASRDVTADVIELALAFVTERESFEQADRQADAVVHALRTRLQGAAPGSEITRELVVLEQERIGWGDEGKKLEHRVVVTALAAPAGDVRPSAVRLVEEALQADRSLTLVSIETKLSPESERALERELLAEATVQARRNADRIAEAAGLRILGARAIHGAPVWIEDPQDGMRRRGYADVGRMTKGRNGGSWVRTQRPFTAHSAIGGRIHYSIGVVGEFAAAAE